jgi:diguanylate cyclase (GGDEF)-like protein
MGGTLAMPKDDLDWSQFLQAAFLAVLEASDEGILVFDPEGRCRMIARRAGEMFGVEPVSHVGRHRGEVLAAFAQACEEPEALLTAAAADGPLGAPKVVVDVDVRRPRPRTVQCKGVPISRDGSPPGRVIFLRDVTRERAVERANKQLQARIAELTPYDPLTGLLNDRRFREEIEREHGRSARAWDSYAVLRLDVDGMSALNDEFGQPVGDGVLERIAACLKACLREYDVLARFENDEFAVLLPGADGVAARAVGERIASAMGEGTVLVGPDRYVTLSIGGSLWVPPSSDSWQDVMRRAGIAVHHARKHGGGGLHVEGA